MQESIQEAPQESAPRRRRTLSGRLTSAVAGFDPWHALTATLDLAARREAWKAKREQERVERALAAGISPLVGLPKVACLKSGCRIPWEDHLGPRGGLKAGFVKRDGHRSAEDVPPRQMDRRERRAIIRSMTERRRPGRRLAPAALYTHTIFVDPAGRKHRVPNDKLDAFVLRNANR